MFLAVAAWLVVPVAAVGLGHWVSAEAVEMYVLVGEAIQWANEEEL